MISFIQKKFNKNLDGFSNQLQQMIYNINSYINSLEIQRDGIKGLTKSLMSNLKREESRHKLISVRKKDEDYRQNKLEIMKDRKSATIRSHSVDTDHIEQKIDQTEEVHAYVDKISFIIVDYIDELNSFIKTLKNTIISLNGEKSKLAVQLTFFQIIWDMLFNIVNILIFTANTNKQKTSQEQ